MAQSFLQSLPMPYQKLLLSSKPEQLQILKAELERRRLNDQGQFYEPNKPIEEFIKLVGTTPNLVYILSTANGLGKTTLIVNLLRALMFGADNRHFSYDLIKNWPFPKRARYITTPKGAEDSGAFRNEVGAWWPRGRYVSRKNGRHFHSEYEANEWFLDVMTYDQAPEQFESNNIGIQILDEPPPRALWPRIVSRTRKGGIVVIVMTPLTDAGWIFDELVPRHQQFVVYGGVEEACKEHGTRGHLDHKDIENMIAEYPPEEREARIQGRAMYLRGVIFKSFDPNVHVLKEPIQAPYSASMYQVVDPHDDKPFACIWGFPDAVGNIFIVEEWPNEDFYKMHNCQLTVEDYARIFKDKEAKWNVRKRIMDRRYGEVSRTTNRKTLREEFAEKTGLHYEQSYSASEEIETGIIKIRSYLKYNHDIPVSELNKPKLYINPGCTNTIKSLNRWSRDPDTGKYQEAYKDFCDTMRYFLMDDPKVDYPLPPHNPVKTYG